MATIQESALTAAPGAVEREKSSVGHRILSGLGGVLCVILLPILIFNCSLIVKGLVDPDEVPKLGGVFPLIVMTDSMYPAIRSGDLIICRAAEPETVQVGDVIAFIDPDGNGVTVVTHRVMEIEKADDGVRFLTQGDANNTADPTPVSPDKLLGLYTNRIPNLGSVIMFMQTTPGLLLCVVLPILLLVGYDLIRRRIYDRRHQGDTDALLRELEELRARQNDDRPQP